MHFRIGEAQVGADEDEDTGWPLVDLPTQKVGRAQVRGIELRQGRVECEGPATHLYSPSSSPHRPVTGHYSTFEQFSFDLCFPIFLTRDVAQQYDWMTAF